MPLRVLDGNQSATTLSSVVTGGEHIVAHTVVSLGSTAISNITTAVSGTTVCVGNLGLLQSTVGTEGVSAAGNFIKIGGHAGTATTGNIVHVSSVGAMRVDGSSFTQPISGSVTISNFPATQTIAGTVTANVFGQDENNVAQPLPLIETDGIENVERELAVSSIIVDNNGNSIFNKATGPLGLPIAARRLGNFAAIDYITAENNRLDTNVKNSVTIGSLPAISGTVTVGAMPNGSLTTRFGTPTTANTAFATSAVTNASRKYLLIQNVTTGSNVITVGIGFTPTTTQGIQLTAGAGITFESSYIPTGAVYVLSSVTASNFTVLEA